MILRSDNGTKSFEQPQIYFKFYTIDIHYFKVNLQIFLGNISKTVNNTNFLLDVYLHWS